MNRLLELLETTLFRVGGRDVTAGALLGAAAVLAGTVLVSRLARRGLDRWLRSRGVTHSGTIAVTARLVRYGILLVGGVAALQVAGVNLSSVFALGAVFALGIGFATQNIIQNFVSGVIILFERIVRPGDVIEVDGQVVRVLNVGFRSTRVRSRLDEDIIVTNSTLVQNNLKNYTLQDSALRVISEVGVSYASDMAAVMATLQDAADRVPWRVADRDPVVLMTRFGDSAVQFEISVWCPDPWAARLRQSDLNFTVWTALQGAGIVIAFPQLDVHLLPPPRAATGAEPASLLSASSTP